jgi:hypothetical protein
LFFLKDDYREEKHRRSSKDYRSTIDDQQVSSSHHRDVFIIENNYLFDLIFSFHRNPNLIEQNQNIVVKQLNLMKMQ